MARVYALLILAWALLRTLVARLFRQRTGLPVFRENYAADGLPPATADERVLLASMSGCIACGLCDTGASSRGYGPMHLVLASSRMSSDADAAVLELANLPDGRLAEREKICPTRVPLVAIAALTRRRAKAVAAMRDHAGTMRLT